jgi:aryl-alcohol dehydrogenase-like predicted oxidoreductase
MAQATPPHHPVGVSDGGSMLTLANGVQLPAVGLGTFRARGNAVNGAVKAAVAAGITHIDSATIYKVGVLLWPPRHMPPLPQHARCRAPAAAPRRDVNAHTHASLLPRTHTRARARARAQNEADIAAALREAGIPRGSVFITSKLSPYQQGAERASAAAAASLQALGSSYVDLLLIHWPGVAGTGAASPDNARLRLQTWRVRLVAPVAAAVAVAVRCALLW